MAKLKQMADDIVEEELLLDIDLFNIINDINPDRKVYNPRKVSDSYMDQLEEQEFIKRFRISKASVNMILVDISEQLLAYNKTDRYVLFHLAICTMICICIGIF